MLNERLAAAKMVAEKLAALENAIDDAIICAAELAAVAPAARRKANLSPMVGQDAIAKTGETLSALYSARAHIVAAHGDYAEVRDQIGIKPSMTGDLWKFASGKQNEPTAIRRVA